MSVSRIIGRINSARWHHFSAYTSSHTSQGSSSHICLDHLQQIFSASSSTEPVPFWKMSCTSCCFMNHRWDCQLVLLSEMSVTLSGYMQKKTPNCFSGSGLDCQCYLKTQQCSQDQTFFKNKMWNVYLLITAIFFLPIAGYSLFFILNCKRGGTWRKKKRKFEQKLRSSAVFYS